MNFCSQLTCAALANSSCTRCLRPLCVSCGTACSNGCEYARSDKPNLRAEALKLLAELKTAQSRNTGVDDSVYPAAPFLPKTTWTQIGNLVSSTEKECSGARVPGDRWISLRLDGSGFSTLTRKFRRLGIFGHGFCPRFATIMQECARVLMTKFNACYGYTQSDEMTLIIPPASIVRGEQQCHARSGRVVKTCTLAASLVTAMFNRRVNELLAESKEHLNDSNLPYFDCRLAHYGSREEAMTLILWRAYDCGVNGVSDAVHHLPGADKSVKSKGGREKLQYLHAQGKLPLPLHQSCGTYFVRVKRIVEGFNPITKQTVKSIRNTIEIVPGNILSLAKNDLLYPVDDSPSSNEEIQEDDSQSSSGSEGEQSSQQHEL